MDIHAFSVQEERNGSQELVAGAILAILILARVVSQLLKIGVQEFPVLNGRMVFASACLVTLKQACNAFAMEYKQLELAKDVLKSLTPNGMSTSVDVCQDTQKSMVSVCLKEV